MLNTFDPMTLPTAISGFPLYVAVADTTNSGSDVPIATIDNAIIKVAKDSVKEKGELFHRLLDHPSIKEYRSRGLMMALEFESYEVVKPIIDEAIRLGVVTDWFLFNDRSMRIAPPLIISKDEIEDSCKIILRAIDKIVT